MNTINNIKTLQEILKNEGFLRMNKSTIKGFLGELFVKHKLENENHKVEHLGNQSGYDLRIGSIKIDVKSSTMSNPQQSWASWGWALHNSGKRQVKCTHFVCVAFNETYQPITYYVIKSENLDKFPAGATRFKNVTHSLEVLKNKEFEFKAQVYLDCEKLINEGLVIKIEKDDNLSQYLD